jgi:glycosyltransferase involved in cell wall biosynthesis
LRFVLVGTAYPHRGGIAHYVALLSRELAMAGHEVKVISFRRQYPRLLFPGTSQDDAGPETVRVDSERLIDTLNPATWIAAARRIRALAPDLVVFKYWMPFFAPAYGTIVRRLRRRGIRTCFLLDNVIPHERRPGDLALTRWVLDPVDAFIAQSETVAADLRRFRPEAPLAKVPHPLYTIFGTKPPREEARRRLGVTAREVALFFGFIRGYKGLLDLLEAVARIPPERDFQLLVGGEFYEDDAPYRRAMEALGSRVVPHTRYIPNEEVGDFFAAANLAVLPYRSATQSGIVQIAYHFDVPVLTTDVGGLPETVMAGTTGDIVPPGDPGALAAAITRYFDEGREDRYAPAVARDKERFSWGRLVEALEAIARGQTAAGAAATRAESAG